MIKISIKKIFTFTVLWFFIFSIFMIFFNGEINGMNSKTIEEVLKEHTDELMSISGVVGVGQGICNSKPCIKVFVNEITDEIRQKIPDKIDSYEVSIEKTGTFRAF